MSINVFEELNKFSDIKYVDSTHEYRLNGVRQTSVTTFIGEFKQKFETEKVAKAYALKHGLEYEKVIEDWNYIRDFASIKGRTFHSCAENFYANKIYEYDENDLTEKWGVSMPIAIKKMLNHFHNFYSDSKKNLIPIKSEVVVGDPEYNISGMVDQIFYNKKFEEIQIFDWKTNKEISYTNNFGNRYLHPISHLDECEFNTYSIQLSLYKHIIQKNTNLKIGRLYIVWFNEMNDTYKVIQCKEMDEEIKLLIKNRKQ